MSTDRFVYQPLPTPPARLPGEGAAHYGARLFGWLVGPDGCTATVQTDDLELAGYAGVGASAQCQDVQILQTLTDTRHTIARVLLDRTLTADRTAQPGPQDDDRPNVGPMAPLVDRPIVRPPSPSYAVPMRATTVPDDGIAF